ncbi:11809_t:CDS:2, partial [Ambispora leptoticha]
IASGTVSDTSEVEGEGSVDHSQMHQQQQQHSQQEQQQQPPQQPPPQSSPTLQQLQAQQQQQSPFPQQSQQISAAASQNKQPITKRSDEEDKERIITTSTFKVGEVINYFCPTSTIPPISPPTTSKSVNKLWLKLHVRYRWNIPTTSCNRPIKF